LTQPPRWQRTGPCGARFAFGGKLVTFGKGADDDQVAASGQPVVRAVDVKNVIADVDVTAEAAQLQQALENDQVAQFCLEKINRQGMLHSY